MYDYNCPVCGNVISSSAPLAKVKCQSCGNEFYPSQQMPPAYTRGVFDNGPSGKNRGVAALLAIFLGSLGIHYFYLGKNTAGIVFLLVSLLSCGVLAWIIEIVSIISGILMLTSSEEDFENKYIYSSSTMPV